MTNTATHPRRQAAILIIAAVLATFLVIPYQLALNPTALDVPLSKGISLGVILLVTCAQSLVMFAIVVFVGLRAARGVGLSAPVSAALADRRPVWPLVRAFAPRALVVGIVGGLVILGLDALIPVGGLQTFGTKTAWWMGLLATPYGAIAEELLMRLFLLSLLLWGLRRIAPRHPDAMFWTANVAAAVLFGLGHLPITAAMGMVLTPIVVGRAILLNGVIGVALGWLYRKDGLESAMLAHGAADIVLHVLTPLAFVALA